MGSSGLCASKKGYRGAGKASEKGNPSNQRAAATLLFRKVTTSGAFYLQEVQVIMAHDNCVHKVIYGLEKTNKEKCFPLSLVLEPGAICEYEC